MKIAYVGAVPPLRGGIAQSGARIIEALRTLGHDVDVRSWAAQYPRRLYPGSEVDPRAASFDARFELSWASPRSWRRTGRSLRGRELLVFPWVTPLQAPAYRILLGAARVPPVAIVHNPIPHERRPGDLMLTKWVLRRVRGAVVLAESVAEQLQVWFPGLPVAVVPHPPNLPIIPGELPPKPPLRLLFFGMVRPYKGLDVAIDAVAELVRDGLDVELTVAGEFWGPVEPWQRTVAERGLEARVDLRPGYVSDGEVSDLFAAHHIVVAPYRRATQSGIVPLAHAAGRPVVASAVGGLPEAVEDGHTGHLVPPGDVGALAGAIDDVSEHLETFSRAARNRSSSWGTVAEALLDVASGGSVRG